MAGTKEGARKAKQTLIAKFGGYARYKEWNSEIGRKGGQISRGGGFQRDSDLAREAGRKGGRASRRGSAA